MFKRILIPTDGSELSERTAQSGVALARALNAKVTGLHVMPLNFALSYGEMVLADESLEQEMRERARAEGNKYLDRVQAAAESAGVPFERVLNASIFVWKGIVDTALEKSCDLIVMAAHGRRGLAALVIGSETNKVLTHTKIPVLVYR